MIGVGLSCVALAACGSGSSGNAGELNGTAWKLSGWTLSSLKPSAFAITASFADGKISGHSGVNNYNGPYKSGSDGSFSVGAIASTMMAGPEPAMRAEHAYLTLLGQARSYSIEGTRSRSSTRTATSR